MAIYRTKGNYEALQLTEDTREELREWGVPVDDPMASMMGFFYMRILGTTSVAAVVSPDEFASRYEAV